MAIFMLSVSVLSAQTTDSDLVGAANGDVVKVVDNKGTIKYLQTNNGITTITSTNAGNKTTTTWQLGGTLTEDTYIDATGAIFAITGIAGIDPTDPGVENAAATAFNGTGFSLLVRDEVTGETKKLLVDDLLSGIRVEYPQVADAAADVAITVLGLPLLTVGTTDAKLFVYRNGVKLRNVADFAVTAGTVTINYDATDLPMYTGDIVEIQYIK